MIFLKIAAIWFGIILPFGVLMIWPIFPARKELRERSMRSNVVHLDSERDARTERSPRQGGRRARQR